MYISDLSLYNIRSYEKQHFSFSPKINLIVGHNNSGKSTILKSIYKLQDNKFNFINKSSIRAQSNIGKIVINLKQINDLNKSYIQRTNHKLKFDKTIEQNSGVIFNFYSELEQAEDNYIYPEILPTINIQNIKPQKIDDLHFSTLPDTEDLGNFIYPFFANRKNNFISNQIGFNDTVAVYGDLRELPSKIQKLSNGGLPKNIEYRRLCKEILGFIPGIIPDKSNANNNFNKIGIYTNDNEMIGIDHMGDGVMNILGLIVLLLTQNGKLYLIEEPENDLHPKALKSLLELIKSKSLNNQFIISTHSNVVVKYLGDIEDSKIFRLNWEMSLNGEFEIPKTNVLEIDDSFEARIELLEFLGYDLLDFNLHSGYIIFEESSAEYFVREVLIPNFTPELVTKIRTIAANGVGDIEPRFNDLHRLYLYTHLDPIYKNRVWVIADGDDSGVETIDKLKIKFSKYDDCFINLKKADFEHYYPERFNEKMKEILKFKAKDKGKYRELKKQLTKEVREFYLKDKETAIKEFEKSAKEVINVLKLIQKKMTRN